ncbi:HNH endonuclease signature motif containing protein [Phytoactinopolyspora mesophila]|uniref:DUF222 domain-containing protein n=1 Tax=Phytoactinopolyspora mesophila TaxID=2650750 RepID=A0A7K3MDM5_9ACTN|nr:HNH endonuclease signature motif containing protein [Phytoactinopolyspora mesophila]NDL60508.1 DUF222 domain-containing protein [Phytoactinopolyspora mesophila]
MSQSHEDAAVRVNTPGQAARAVADDVDAAWVRLIESEFAGDAECGAEGVSEPERPWTDPEDSLGACPSDPDATAAPGVRAGQFGLGPEADSSRFATMVPGTSLAMALEAFPLSQLDVHEVADAVAAWERIVAWARAKQAEAAAELTRRPEIRPDNPHGFGALHPVPVAAGALCAVRPWTKPQAEKLVDHAVTLVEECPNVHAALAQGRLDESKARILTRTLNKCGPGVAALIEKAVLPFVHGWTDVKLSRVVNELLHELDAAGAKHRHREARSRRDVWVEPADEGMAWLVAYLPAEEAAAVLAALNAVADARDGTDGHGAGGASADGDGARGEGAGGEGAGGEDPDIGARAEDPAASRDAAAPAAGSKQGSRTRAQRRADALASFGWSSLATGHLGGHECAECGAATGTRLATMHGRPVSVNITIPMTALLGLSEHPAHLDGYGPIDADAARALAAAGFWRWVGTAPAGGHAIDYGTTRYSPPQELVDFVLLRDRECMAPGCHRPAMRCEIDHRRPWPYGPTSACNCSALCKPCHMQKHRAGWHVKDLGNGRQQWTSPTGHTSVVQIPRIAPDAADTPSRNGSDTQRHGVHDPPGSPQPSGTTPPDTPPF